MLPEKISNGLCSLKPQLDRLSITCEMKIDQKGVLVDFDFYESVVHSHGRLTYNDSRGTWVSKKISSYWFDKKVRFFITFT